jgi:hypothetical protein
METDSHPVAAFIKARGGPSAVAEAIGKTAGAVRMMKHRGRLPREVWPEIVEAYPDVTLDELKQIEAHG